MAKTPSEYLAAVQRMTCCTQYPERGDPYGSLEVEPDGGLVRASDFVAAIEAAQAEARAEERARCAGLMQAAWESLRGDEPALLALQVYAATIEERTDEPEPGWGDRAVDEARAAGTEPGPAGEEG